MTTTQNIETLAIVIKESLSNVNESVVDGFAELKAEIQEKNRIIEEQQKELKDQQKEIEQLKQNSSSIVKRADVIESIQPPISLAKHQALEEKVLSLELMLKRLLDANTTWFYDLKKQDYFKNIDWTKSTLELDYKSRAITGEELNKVLLKFMPWVEWKEEEKAGAKPIIDEKKIKKVFAPYKFGPRVITRESGPEYVHYNAGDWLKNDIKLKGQVYPNKFDTSNPRDAEITLGTGVGKSTHTLRCIAFGGASNKKWGASLVVPNSSLINSVLNGHNKWLSQGRDVKLNENGELVNDDKKRVSICVVCGGKHTADIDEKGNLSNIYETKHNEESNMINVFTYWEFLEAYYKNPSIIKPWVVVDEAHEDTPSYASFVNSFASLSKDKGQRKFGFIRMSATFSTLPTLGILAGQASDYYTTDFALAEKSLPNSDFFNKKIMIFCDYFEKLDLSPLNVEIDGKKIKYIMLDDVLKDGATDIVRSISAPLLIFAKNCFSVGFSPGDVGAIDTARVKRTIIVEDKNGRLVNIEVGVKSQFADLCQKRGRICRVEEYVSDFFSMTENTNEKINPKIYNELDVASKVIENFVKLSPRATKEEKAKAGKELERVIAKLAEEPPRAKLDIEAGSKYLKLVLLNQLVDKLNPNIAKVSAKDKKDYNLKPYQIIFENKLLEYRNNETFKEELSELIISATVKVIKKEFARYSWINNFEQVDDYVFDNTYDLEWCAFYLQARDMTKTSFEFITDKKKERLVITFKPLGLSPNQLKETFKITEEDKQEQEYQAEQNLLNKG